jgi:MFS family permease
MKWFSLSPNIRLAGIAFLLWATAYNVTAPLLPLFARQLGGDPVQVGIVAAAASMGAVLLVLPISMISDWAGRRWGLLLGWSLSAAGLLLMAAATSWQGLLPGSFLSMAAVAALPTLNTLILEESAPVDRVRNFTLLYGAGPLGLLVGSPIGGWAAEAYGLRSGILIAALLAVVAAFATLPIAGGIVSDNLQGVGVQPSRTPRATLLLFALLVAGAFLSVSLPGNFIAPYLYEVRGQTFLSTGLFTAGLAAAQLFWSFLFTLWPREEGRVRLQIGRQVWSLPRSILLALAICLGANALFGFLLPLAGSGFWLAALFLRGSYYTLQGLGSALVGEVVPEGRHRTTRLTLASAAVGLGAAGAPILGGKLYAILPALPFWITGGAAAIGASILITAWRALPSESIDQNDQVRDVV